MPFRTSLLHQLQSTPAQLTRTPSSLAHVKSELPYTSYPGYLPENLALYQPRHSLFPCGVNKQQMRFLPHISSSVNARLSIKSSRADLTCPTRHPQSPCFTRTATPPPSQDRTATTCAQSSPRQSVVA